MNNHNTNPLLGTTPPNATQVDEEWLNILRSIPENSIKPNSDKIDPTAQMQPIFDPMFPERFAIYPAGAAPVDHPDTPPMASLNSLKDNMSPEMYTLHPAGGGGVDQPDTPQMDNQVNGPVPDEAFGIEELENYLWYTFKCGNNGRHILFPEFKAWLDMLNIRTFYIAWENECFSEAYTPTLLNLLDKETKSIDPLKNFKLVTSGFITHNGAISLYHKDGGYPKMMYLDVNEIPSFNMSKVHKLHKGEFVPTNEGLVSTNTGLVRMGNDAIKYIAINSLTNEMLDTYDYEDLCEFIGITFDTLNQVFPKYSSNSWCVYGAFKLLSNKSCFSES